MGAKCQKYGAHDIPDAVWNGRDSDRYGLSREGISESIDEWGVWLDHTFNVDGMSGSRRWEDNYLNVTDRITGAGWVHGTPSTDVALTGSASWSGEDSFLGVDLRTDSLGRALRADTELTYRPGASPVMDVAIDGFEAHERGSGWTNASRDGWGDLSYSLACGAAACTDGRSVTTQFYADDRGDASGWVGGVVRDTIHSYAGAFVAEKD